MMSTSITMSIAFISGAREARVSKAVVERRERFFAQQAGVPQLVRMNPPSQWPILLAQFPDGRALVQAGTQIGIGYEVYLPNPSGTGFLDTARIVGAIDRESRATTNEWIITWDGQTPPRALGPQVTAVLPTDIFAQRLLWWVHDITSTGGSTALLADFAPDDVTLNSVMPLAEHLASDGLLDIGTDGEQVTVALTAEGLASAERAAAARTNPKLRAQALRNGMITWLSERENASNTPYDWEYFLIDARSTFCGDFFTLGELAREAQYLAERGLIRSLSTNSSGTDFGWIRPQLTASGRDCNDDHGGNVAEFLKPEHPSGPTTIITNNPGAQIATGDNNSQTSNAVPAPRTAQEPPKIGVWRKAWKTINSLTGIGILIGTIVLVYLTYLLVSRGH